MGNLYSFINTDKSFSKINFILKTCFGLLFLAAMAQGGMAQSVLFDFDSAPQYTSLPISQTCGGITAHFATTGQGYSIQAANTLGFTPTNFAGNCIYPNSVYLADLLIKFDQSLTDFSIMYSCQELGCDDAATMRVTAFMNGSLVGTNTRCTSHPGTWPVDTLACSFPQGFDSVVVHYDSRPPTCADYGVIYLADNMRVTALGVTSIADPKTFIDGLTIPNPVSQSAAISFSLFQPSKVNITIYDISGRIIKNLFDGSLCAGVQQINWNTNDDAIENGVYFLKVTSGNFSGCCKVVVEK